MSVNLLPEDYRHLSIWGKGDCTPGEDVVEVRTAEAVLAANAQGFTAEGVYFTVPEKTADDLRRIIGKCRVIADSLEDLHLIGQTARDASAPGTLSPVGLRLSLDGWEGQGISLDTLPAVSRELRRLPAISVRGCFVQGDAAGRGVRYFRECFEAAKRMSAVLPCGAGFLCIVGGGEAAQYIARKHPESLPEFLRTAEIVAAQNRSAFYAKLLVT